MKSTTALMRLLLSTLLVGLLSACNNATADFRAELVTDGAGTLLGDLRLLAFGQLRRRSREEAAGQPA